MAKHPAQADTKYKVSAVREFAETEEESYEEEDLVYRVNESFLARYEYAERTGIGAVRRTVIEKFHVDATNLATQVLRSDEHFCDVLFKMYVGQALYTNTKLEYGCVTYKSHWSGFAATCPNRALIALVQSTYIDRSTELHQMLQEVINWRSGIGEDSTNVLENWYAILKKYEGISESYEKEGVRITPAVQTLAESKSRKEWLDRHTLEPNPLLDLLYSSEKHLMRLGADQGVSQIRVMTNILYLFTTMVGGTYLDKMMLCYYVHRAVEDTVGCDLTDILRGTLQRLERSSELSPL
jgi:hypothetical protein